MPTLQSQEEDHGLDISFLLKEWKGMLAPSSFVSDVLAGVTVALVALPLNLALAIASGVEPGVGIITGIVAGIVAALFGGQRLAVTGPTATIAVVLIQLAQSYGLQAVWFVGMLAALMQLAAGFLRLGRFVNSIPMPVTVGFSSAIGVLVAFNAMDYFFGLPLKPVAHPGCSAPFAGNPMVPEFFQDVSHLIFRIIVHHEASLAAVCVGLLSVFISLYAQKVTKAIPGPLLAVVFATLAANFFHVATPRIVDLARIPTTLPWPHLPNLPWNQVDALFGWAVTVFVLGSLETLLSASVADGMAPQQKPHNPNQELVGQGLANLVVPLFGGIPVSAVIARTAINVRAGAKTRLASLSHSLVLLVIMVLLAKMVEQIPLAALGGILIVTGFRLVEWDTFVQIWKASRLEAYVVLATVVISVATDLSIGVLAGLLFTCGLFIRQMSRVEFKSPAASRRGRAGWLDHLPSCGYVRTYVIEGPLFFGAARGFARNITLFQDLKALILVMHSVPTIDMTGVESLLTIHRKLAREKTRLVLAELRPQARQILKKSKAIAEIGPENIFNNYADALFDVNLQLLQTTCSSCASSVDPRASKGHPPKNCELQHALAIDNSPTRLLYAQKFTPEQVTPETESARVLPVNSLDDLPPGIRNTPIATLFEAQNLGKVDLSRDQAPGARLIIGMCMDYRKILYLPKQWAYVIRRPGANMAGNEFGLALALSGGIKYMALIAHNKCAMANTDNMREAFVKRLSEDHNWNELTASRFFDDHSRSDKIEDEIDFVLDEAERLCRIFTGLTVVPMLYNVDDNRLYLISDWVKANSPV